MAQRAWSCCRTVGRFYMTTTMHGSMPHDVFQSLSQVEAHASAMALAIDLHRAAEN
jgi:hypothetical protein